MDSAEQVHRIRLPCLLCFCEGRSSALVAASSAALTLTTNSATTSAASALTCVEHVTFEFIILEPHECLRRRTENLSTSPRLPFFVGGRSLSRETIIHDHDGGFMLRAR